VLRLIARSSRQFQLVRMLGAHPLGLPRLPRLASSNATCSAVARSRARAAWRASSRRRSARTSSWSCRDRGFTGALAMPRLCKDSLGARIRRLSTAAGFQRLRDSVILAARLAAHRMSRFHRLGLCLVQPRRRRLHAQGAQKSVNAVASRAMASSPPQAARSLVGNSGASRLANRLPADHSIALAGVARGARHRGTTRRDRRNKDVFTTRSRRRVLSQVLPMARRSSPCRSSGA
jgi:hypothetical protein